MRQHPLEIIGLYAGVAGGKSTIARLFAELGAVVLDADKISHEALADVTIKTAIAARFGRDVVAADGAVDRRALAERVFADPAARKALEALVHPFVFARIEAELSRLRDDSSVPAVILDVPLLVGSRLEPLLTRRVFIFASEATRHARAHASRGWSPDEVRRREAAQPSEADKRARCEFTIDNDRDEADVRVQVERLWNDWRSAGDSPAQPSRPSGGQRNP